MPSITACTAGSMARESSCSAQPASSIGRCFGSRVSSFDVGVRALVDGGPVVALLAAAQRVAGGVNRGALPRQHAEVGVGERDGHRDGGGGTAPGRARQRAARVQLALAPRELQVVPPGIEVVCRIALPLFGLGRRLERWLGRRLGRRLGRGIGRGIARGIGRWVGLAAAALGGICRRRKEPAAGGRAPVVVVAEDLHRLEAQPLVRVVDAQRNVPPARVVAALGAVDGVRGRAPAAAP